MILERIAVGMAAWAERRSAGDVLDHVNEWLVRRGDIPVGSATLRADRARAVQLRREETISATDTHLAEYDHALSEAWNAFRTADPKSLNRSAFMGHIRSLVESKAKLDGSLAAGPDQVTHITINQVNLTFTALTAAMTEQHLPEVTRKAILASMADKLRIVEHGD